MHVVERKYGINNSNHVAFAWPFRYHSCIYNEVFTFFWILVRYGYSNMRLFWYPSSLFPTQNLHTYITTALATIQSQVTTTQIITHVSLQIFYHLEIPTKYQHLSDITISILTGNMFYETIVDTMHSPLYWHSTPSVHWVHPRHYLRAFVMGREGDFVYKCPSHPKQKSHEPICV